MTPQVTELAFHFNVPDRVAYACRLLRKAVASGAKVVVTGPDSTLEQLDAALWTFSAHDFVAHCGAQAEAKVIAASPIYLAENIDKVPHLQILLNLGSHIPTGPGAGA